MIAAPVPRALREAAAPYGGAPVLVTGGAGAIGGNLVQALAAAGAEVTVLDDLSSGFADNLPQRPNVRLLAASVLDEAALAAAFARRPRWVFHLAALFANQNSIEHPERDLAVNGTGLLRVLARAAEQPPERFVFSSSSCLYPAGVPQPMREESAGGPHTTPYQATKALGEHYCEIFERQHGVPTVRARLFNSYGPGERSGRYRNVIPNFIARALAGQPLPITGSGEETRDFTFVADIATGLLLCGTAKAAVGASINLGSGRETRIGDLAEAINRETGNSAGVACEPRRSWDTIARRVAAIDRARDLLGFAPAVALEEGLSATVAWLRARPERWRG